MQGHPVRGLSILQTGSVKLTQTSSAGDEVILWISGRGDAVGLNCGECPCSHTCSARALETCKVLTWDCAKVQALLAAYPQIRTNINQMLTDRLKEIEERFREVATEKVAKRLAMTLLRLIKKVGTEHHAGIQISLSREELAQMTGTTLFTISRILSKWRDMGLVLPRREAVVVVDPTRLEETGEESSTVDPCSKASSDY
jgi:CRP-like cAMP-binding protein